MQIENLYLPWSVESINSSVIWIKNDIGETVCDFYFRKENDIITFDNAIKNAILIVEQMNKLQPTE